MVTMCPACTYVHHSEVYRCEQERPTYHCMVLQAQLVCMAVTCNRLLLGPCSSVRLAISSLVCSVRPDIEVLLRWLFLVSSSSAVGCGSSHRTPPCCSTATPPPNGWRVGYSHCKLPPQGTSPGGVQGCHFTFWCVLWGTFE